MRPTNPQNKTDIIEIAIPLFARAGHDGVSMRQIAKAVGIKASSIYHHFPDKQTLYLAAIKHAFSDKAKILSESLTTADSPEKRLNDLIARLCEIMSQSPDFSSLVQRELLDGDEERLQLLAKQIFNDLFSSITELSKKLAPERDAHLVAISLIGLAAYHYQTKSIRQYLSGSKDEHNNPEVVAQHIISLFTQGLVKERNK